jgi:hypothetical protein
LLWPVCSVVESGSSLVSVQAMVSTHRTTDKISTDKKVVGYQNREPAKQRSRRSEP